MQKRLTACVLTMLSIICGAAFDQLMPAQKIVSVTTLLKSLETRDLRPLAYIDSHTYTQHNLQVADGPAGVRELVTHPPSGTTVHFTGCRCAWLWRNEGAVSCLTHKRPQVEPAGWTPDKTEDGRPDSKAF
jgi:hypothetical protein